MKKTKKTGSKIKRLIFAILALGTVSFAMASCGKSNSQPTVIND